MRRFAQLHPEATFVQIGANDGVALDPLRIEIARRRWRGVMVEPVPYVFRRLYQRYGDHPRISLEEVAIADREGSLPFFHLREAKPGESVWPWYHALGSFRREVLVSHDHLIPDIKQRVVETQVSCITFDTLCQRNQLSTIDLLQIDTEGYDYEILRHIDFNRWKPQLVVYEHVHLTPTDRQAAQVLLDRYGYSWIEQGIDTIAIDLLRNPDPRLKKIFLPSGS